MGCYKDDELLMLSGIQHFAFCRRQWALIHIEQQWQENISTYGGKELHKRVDDPLITEARGTVITTRSLPIVSYQLGLYGIADVVEFHRSQTGVKLKGRAGLWAPLPVEYKYGRPKIGNHDIVQLCAQGICLEEMFGLAIGEGFMFYGQTRRRQKVVFSDDLRSEVAKLCLEMHKLFAIGKTPLPKQSREACRKCSLRELCLPQICTNHPVRRYIDAALQETDIRG